MFTQRRDVFSTKIQTIVSLRGALVRDIIFAAVVELKIIVGPAGGKTIGYVESCFQVGEETFGHDGSRMCCRKRWHKLAGIVQVITFGIEVRIADPVVEIFKSLFISPEEFDPLRITTAGIIVSSIEIIKRDRFY